MKTSVLDTSGERCPIPVMKAAKAMQGLAPGDVLEVISTDAGSVEDFQVFCETKGHVLLSSSEQTGTFRFSIKKGP